MQVEAPRGLLLDDPATPLTRSDVLPLLSSRVRLLRSRGLIPMLVLTVASFAIAWLPWIDRADAASYYAVIGTALLINMFYLVYFISGETETTARHWFVGIVTYLQCSYLYWPVFAPIFRFPLGDIESGSFLSRWGGYFIAAGLCEELLKAVPALIGLVVAIKEGGQLRSWFALKGPLDGLLLGVAAGIGFTIWETLAPNGYVTNATGRVGQDPTSAMLAGSFLMVLRVLDSFGVHVGLSAIFGYFIGLAATHPAAAMRLVGFGWVLSALLHGLLDAVGGGRTQGMFLLVAVAILLLFLSCLLKARWLEAPRLAAGGSTSVPLTAEDLRLHLDAGRSAPPHPGPPLGSLVGIVEASLGLRSTPTPADIVPPGGLAIGTAARRYALVPGRLMDLPALFPGAGIPPGQAGVIDRAPSGRLEIRNTGSGTWTAILPGRDGSPVPPGGCLEPIAGLRLRLDAAEIDVMAYGR